MNGEKILIGVFLVGMALLLTHVFNPDTGFLLAQFPTGWTTLSLSQAIFQSSNPFFTGKVWVLTVAQGGMGQHAVGTISKEDIKSKSGVQPKNDLKIEITYSKAAWEYPIKVDYTSTPVYHFEIYTTQSWNPLFDYKRWAKETCGKSDTDIYYGKIGGLPPTYWCIEGKRKTSYIGTIDNCNFHFISKIKVSAGGESYEKTIDSKNRISTYIGPYVYVIWNGNLIKSSCPATDTYLPFYSNGWKLGYKNYYDNYKAKYNYFTSQMNKIVGESKSYTLNELKNMINDVNSWGDKFVTTKAYFGTIENSADTSKAYISLPVSSDVQVPTYTFYVKASWLGIYQPTPKPVIVDAKGTKFKSGEYGYLYAKIRNDGEKGNIVVWAKCQSPINVLDTSKTYTLNSGETITSYIRVGYNGYSHVSASCIIYAQGQGTNNIVSRTVSVTADPQTVCNAGEMICENNVIKQCNRYGSGWNIVKTCTSDEYCTYISGQPTCVKQGGKPVPPIPKPKFNILDLIKNVLLAIIIIIIIGMIIKLIVIPILKR